MGLKTKQLPLKVYMRANGNRLRTTKLGKRQNLVKKISLWQ